MITKHLKNFFIVWLILLVLNQAFIFSGCFAPYCILAALPHTGVIAFLFILYFIKKEDNANPKNRQLKQEIEDALQALAGTTREAKKNARIKKAQKTCPLKQKGDLYEKFIGKEFEKKGELVIYNGFIRGYEDDGVDLIIISIQTQTIHLIQCKNWTKKPLLLNDVQDIYKKLQSFSLTRITQNAITIQEHLEIDKSLESIKDILRVNKSDYLLRKTLYVGSDKVVDLNIGKHLKLITPTIFKYEEMKIVIKSFE